VLRVTLLALVLVAGCASDDDPVRAECRDSACACTGDRACELVCGAGCKAICGGSGRCAAAVGDDSEVSCTGAGGCDVLCYADCNVHCGERRACLVRCQPGTNCRLDQCDGGVIRCRDDIYVCGTNCPE